MECLRIVVVIFSLISFGSCHTMSASNPQQLQNTQLANVESNQKSSDANAAAANQFFYRTTGNPQASYIPNYQPGQSNAPMYTRETPGASPFLGLSSNGEFQLSAYFSQIFWGVVGVTVGIAVIIWLIRLIYPNHTFGKLVEKIQSTKAGKNLDLDRITNMVYDAIDEYSKRVMRDIRAPTLNPKRR